MVLIPLAGAALLSVGRHPLAGLAMGFAAVGGAFTVNMLIKPLDAVLVEFTNDAIQLVNPGVSIGLASNLWFSVASVAFLTVFIGLMSERVIEPRLGVYQPVLSGGEQSGDEEAAREDGGFRPMSLGGCATRCSRSWGPSSSSASWHSPRAPRSAIRPPGRWSETPRS
jgi:aminobenzoyl-glutamate transport protein